MGDNGYALDLSSPVRHVATEMDRAAPASLSIEELAAGYRHAIPGDLARIKLHEGCANDDEATTWLIGRAVKEITYQGKTARSRVQVAEEPNGSYRLADGVTFEDLRYQGQKLHRAFAEGEEDAQRALRAVYNDLNAERAFYVTVAGARGGSKELRLRLHPLAHAIPHVSEKEFFELAADVERHGVRNPITVFDGQVLDGRHRLAVASALKVPLRVVEFVGDETAARDEVISQNVQRRHLTIAQRGLIVRELYLPQAEAETKERVGGRPSKDGEKPTADMRQVSRGPTAAEIAAKEANGLATARTIETMAPVDDAPKTQERIRRGEIKTAAEARREALKETGSDEPEEVPALRPRSAFHNLGLAIGSVRNACDALQRGDRGADDVTDEKLVGRINELRALLDHAEGLLDEEAEAAVVLMHLRLLIQRNGFSPSVKELAAACGIAPSTCYAHLHRLMVEGHVTEEPGKARTLRVVDRESEHEREGAAS